ncbi:MAG: DUF397 domain-containing protein [Actinophytocola sp.]|uniref:DUF397 domain-containing protein n=1 Tax=Actinophytocola sp. TaxID=1872138 RepID=UPI003C795F72
MAADGQGRKQTRTWRRSSLCSPVGNCVDISRAHADTVIRDSKSATELPPLAEPQWRAFMDFCRLPS